MIYADFLKNASFKPKFYYFNLMKLKIIYYKFLKNFIPFLKIFLTFFKLS
jgi:hypothetical protein